MAKNKKNDEAISKREINKVNANNKVISSNINRLIDSMHNTVFGTSDNTDVQAINDEFQAVMKEELDVLRNSTNGDTTAFITKIVSNAERNRLNATQQIQDFLNGDGMSSLDSDMQEAYQNNMLKRQDIHEVASKLNELREAINITRDAIVSSDVTNGRMSRNITFSSISSEDDNRAEYDSIVKKMEERFDLHKKIKNFIIPNTLEQGVYYTYTVPYSKMFDDFARYKEKRGGNLSLFTESVYDINSANIPHQPSIRGRQDKKPDYITQIFNNLSKEEQELFLEDGKNTFVPEVKDILSRITISNDIVPIVALEEGMPSVNKLYTESVYYESANTDDKKQTIFFTEASKKDKDNKQKKKKNRFDELNSTDVDNGVIDDSKEKGQFANIKDCYIKMIDSMHLLPIEIMKGKSVIGYYYVHEDPHSGNSAIGDSLYEGRYTMNRRQQTLANVVADEIIRSFNKDFLEENQNFKELILEAITYYNLSERKIRFQFIPKEYIVEHKTNEDENGNGRSIIESSLFYAKLYLVLLLFKMMSIIDYSNDTRVHYVRTSGIDKNVTNKIQEITRKMQNRKINMLDMFSYTTLVNKIGNGTDRFIPLGRTDVRGIESEILSGQDVQLNNELLELLKTGYISATGVPSVMLNYLNEADFAKTIELGNVRFTDNVISHQLDFNQSITQMYRNILKYATNIPQNIIDTFQFSFSPPKAATNTVTRDMLDTFEAYFSAMVPVAFGEVINNNRDAYDSLLQKFRIKLIRDQLPMINVDAVLKFAEEAKREEIEEKLKPTQDENGEDGASTY